MFNKNVYKMTVVCCNYAVASYLLSVTTLPPGNRRRAFYWEKYRRSAGDSCIANEPPENAQWNTPSVTVLFNTSTNSQTKYTKNYVTGNKYSRLVYRSLTNYTVLTFITAYNILSDMTVGVVGIKTTSLRNLNKMKKMLF